jgi:hypothetical protein
VSLRGQRERTFATSLKVKATRPEQIVRVIWFADCIELITKLSKGREKRECSIYVYKICQL